MSGQSNLRVEMTVGFKTKRHGGKVLTAKQEPREKQRPQLVVSREARLLALAHRWQRLLDEGQIESQAEIARTMGLSAARVSQIMDLALLPPIPQERMAFDADPGEKL